MTGIFVVHSGMARFIDISAFRFPPKGWMLAVCMVFIVAEGHSQAKVVNGGFESFLSLPTASGQLGLLPGWSNGGSDIANPDFYHEQGENGGDLPQTPLAMVNPHSGRGIAGFVAYTDDFNPHHEYITGSFSEPLEANARYKFTFHISSGQVHEWANAGLGVSDLGVVFATTLPAQDGHKQLMKSPKFQIHETLYHRGWREISFVFSAEMAYTSFTLGLFKDEPKLRREEPGTRTVAYYFVDDFAIEEVSSDWEHVSGGATRGMPGEALPPGVFVPNAFTPNGDLVNDEWACVLPESTEGQISIVNRWGAVVWKAAVSESSSLNWDGLDRYGVPCESGAYAWQLKLSEPVGDRVQWCGMVNLIR